MSEARPHNYISCAAVLVVSDIHASAAFYRDGLGFDVAGIWGSPPSFAIANSPAASVMLKQAAGEADGGEPAPNEARVAGLWDAYIWVRDLDALIADLAQRGTQHSAPALQPHGCTEITVRDPDGHIICFGFCP